MFVLWQEVTWSFCNLPFLSNAGLRVGIPKGDCGIHRNILNRGIHFMYLHSFGSGDLWSNSKEYLSARESSYMLHAVSQTSQWCYNKNSSNVCLIEAGPVGRYLRWSTTALSTPLLLQAIKCATSLAWSRGLLEVLNTSDLPKCKPLASSLPFSFLLTPARPVS